MSGPAAGLGLVPEYLCDGACLGIQVVATAVGERGVGVRWLAEKYECRHVPGFKLCACVCIRQEDREIGDENHVICGPDKTEARRSAVMRAYAVARSAGPIFPILHECHPRDHKVRPQVASVKSTGILGVWHDGVDVRSSLAGRVN